MTRTRYGILAGVAGAAFAWWWRQRMAANQAAHQAASRGEVIFTNSPIV